MKNQSRRSFIRGAVVNSALLSVVPLTGMGIKSITTPVMKDEVPRLPLKIYLRGDIGEKARNEIMKISDKISISADLSGSLYEDALEASNVWLGHIGRNDFIKAKNLRWVQSSSAGVEHYLYDELINGNIILTNAKGCYAPAIGEHVIGLLFSLTRKIGSQARNMISGNWSGESGILEMKDMTMGVVGFGGIGRQTARRAKAMDMKVIAADIVPMYIEQIGDLCDEMYMVQDGGLNTLLEKSDVVVCAVPHTPASEGMFNAGTFSKMKKGSWFINVSRGKLVKTPDLTSALQSGHISGAGLDVTDPEPLPASHELWKMPNVIITSHIAGQSQHSNNRLLEVFVENVRRYVNGYPLLNLVDKKAGF